VWLFGATVALSVVGFWFDLFGALVWGVDALLVLGFAFDYLRIPGSRQIEVERVLPERVGLSREFHRTLTVSGANLAGRRVEVHERFPELFTARGRSVGGQQVAVVPGDPTGGPDVGVVPEDGELVLTRSYRSDVRGSFDFGELRLLVRGELGLVDRSIRLSGTQSVAIEPALANLKNTLRLAASDRWQDLGVRLVRRRGGETEFESLREYVHGDELRRVDWKAFARRGKPMVRQYQVERGQELILLVDCGRRMRITTARGKRRGWTKLDWALDAALELAAVALSKGDRVGAAAFERGLTTYVAPAKASHQLTRLSQALFHLQPTDHDSDLERALRELAARHRRRATVILISDVADPYSVQTQRRALTSASRRHRLVFAALDDPGLRAAADGKGVSTPVRAAALELAEDRGRALRELATSGARVLDALPAEAAAPLLAAWLDERRR